MAKEIAAERSTYPYLHDCLLRRVANQIKTKRKDLHFEAEIWESIDIDVIFFFHKV